MALRRSNLTPQFSWDDAAGRYRNARGHFVSREDVRSAIDKYLDNKTGQFKVLGEQLRDREISIAQWQRAMEREIAKVHLANLAAAKGGWHNLNQADYGRVGRIVRSEYKYLRAPAKQIEAGLSLNGRFMQRVQQYAQAGRATYHIIEAREMEVRGFDECRTVRHVRDSCEECVRLAALGWQSIGTIKLPGLRICMRNCRCTMEYRKSTAKKDANVRQNRKRRQTDRRQKRRRRDQGGGEDWGDPKVHAYYGGGQPNGGGSDLLSPRLLSKLQEHTHPRSNEFGVLIDRESGNIVFMGEGQRRRMEFDESVMAAYDDIVPVHTHDDDSAFSPGDWNAFVLAPNVSVELLVGPKAIYVLRKGAQYDAFPAALGNQHVGQFWLKRYDELMDNPDFLRQFESLHEADRTAIEQVNHELAQLHGVEFERVDMEELK